MINKTMDNIYQSDEELEKIEEIENIVRDEFNL